MNLRPMRCVNHSCTNILYVPRHRQHLPLQCDDCIERRRRRLEAEADHWETETGRWTAETDREVKS